MTQKDITKKGKLFKRDDAILGQVQLVTFKFDELKPTRVIETDNSRASLIHTRLHDEDSVARMNQIPKNFNVELIKPENRAPVIHPRDFTQDWINQRAKSRKSRSNIDDEDELDRAELEELSKQTNISAILEDQNTEQKHAEDRNQTQEIGLQANATPDEMNQKLEETLTKSNQEQSMDMVGDAIKRVSSINPSEESTSQDLITEVPAPSLTEDQTTKVDQQTKANQEAALANEAAIRETMNPTPDDSESEPEQGSIAVDLDSEDLNKSVEEAKQQGFTEGLAEGKSEGVEQVKQIAGELLSNIQSVLGDLEHLKKDVLNSAQDNFVEICQALGTALLDHEFKINPESFKRFVEKAISQTVRDDSFQIKCSDEAYETLKDIADDSLLSKIKVDPNLKNKQFEIESDVGNIHSDPQAIVKDLLEKAEVSLFNDDVEEAG